MVSPSDTERFKIFLDENEIVPNEKIGQHFLIDPEALELIAEQALPGANVIEVGSGIGNLTELLAQKAQAVLGLEVDLQFEELLTRVAETHPNVTIEFIDALKVDFQAIVEQNTGVETQIVANPPYHISEPLMKKIAGLPISRVILLVGDKLAATMTAAEPDSPNYTKMTFLTQAFFHPDVIANVPKTSFYPQPRTQSNVVGLTPREIGEFRGNRRLAVQRELASPENQQFTVVKAIKTALVSLESNGPGKSGLSPKLANRAGRRATKQELRRIISGLQSGQSESDDRGPSRLQVSSQIIEELEIPPEILSRPFFSLDNQAVRLLAQALIDHL